MTELREALYRGELRTLPATQASLALAADVRALVARVLGSDDLRHAPLSMEPMAVFRAMGEVRRTLYLDARFHEAARAVVDACGFPRDEVAFDPLRLRVVAHDGHLEPRARAVYLPHRDTWYAHPRAIVTWWIPLHDVEPEETFEIYPDWFERPVPNDSERFDYDAWVARGWDLKIGWQDPQAGRTAVYPSAIEDVPRGRVIGVRAKEGENLLFSGAHFHQTLPQSLGRVRYSLDFRVVHLGDHASGRGAPDVDNRSRGSCLRDYTHPGDP